MTNNGGDNGRAHGISVVADRVTRPLVTLALVGVFCYGFLIDKISGETFGNIVISVTAFWFAQRGQETRASDRQASDTAPGATATAPPSGGTATATVTPSKPKGD